MARQYQLPDYVREARKKRTVKTRDRYNITAREALALDNDISRNSTAREWGMSPRMMDALIDRHRNGNAAMKRAIEEQLDDINYHSEARSLAAGDYNGALRENKKYYAWVNQRRVGAGRPALKPTARYAKQYGMITG